MAKQSSQRDKSFFSDWLEKLQQESWQLELLISGFTLFGIWEARSGLIDYHHFTVQNSGDGFMKMVLFPLDILLNVGWYIFFLNLLIHVVLRGLWIGAIGLRYVSNDIDYEALNFSERFTTFFKKKIGTYDDFIEKLEKICSVLFAYTFLLFLLFLSAIMYFLFLVTAIWIIHYLLPDKNSVNQRMFTGFFFILYIVLGLIVFVDFITLGFFKKINEKHISLIYMYLFRFFSLITLSFLYRPLLYNFIDDRYTKRLFFFSIPYILLICTGKFLFTNNTKPYFPSQDESLKYGKVISDDYYGDLKTKHMAMLDPIESKGLKLKITDVHLKEFYQSSEFQSIFIKMKPDDISLFESSENKVEPIYKSGLRLDLFSSEKSKIKELSVLDSLHDIEVSRTVKERMALKKERKKATKAKDEKRVEALNKDIEKLTTELESKKFLISEKKEKYKNNQLDLIIENMQSWVKMNIDGTSYSDSLNCHFYAQPISGIQGILCHYSIESLDKGYHNLTIERKYKEEEEGNNSSEFKLPFIKTY